MLLSDLLIETWGSPKVQDCLIHRKWSQYSARQHFSCPFNLAHMRSLWHGMWIACTVRMHTNLTWISLRCHFSWPNYSVRTMHPFIYWHQYKFVLYLFNQIFNLLTVIFSFYKDQKNLDEEISRLRKDLKPKVSKLHELEG